MSGAIWLASYPRSGNTWTRSALLSLQVGRHARSDFSDLSRFGRMATGRDPFDAWLLMDSALLTIAQIEASAPGLSRSLFRRARPAAPVQGA